MGATCSGMHTGSALFLEGGHPRGFGVKVYHDSDQRYHPRRLARKTWEEGRGRKTKQDKTTSLKMEWGSTLCAADIPLGTCLLQGGTKGPLAILSHWQPLAIVKEKSQNGTRVVAMKALPKAAHQHPLSGLFPNNLFLWGNRGDDPQRGRLLCKKQKNSEN